MRTVNLRDDVIYAVARKMGFDPLVSLQTDQAEAYVSFINAWVRRLYPAFDWPEWTFIEQRTPVNHYISWNEAGKSVIGRVLAVYLRDPQTTNAIGLDAPGVRLEESGVFCGFEHGTNVWLKYIKEAPEYSAANSNVDFPEQIADLVVRGAYSDALKEDGQTDKGLAEEQAVLQEAQLKTGIQIRPPYAPMTDQARPSPRYRAPSPAT
jgi:hypothetical protein